MTDFEQVYELYFKDVYKYALFLTRNEAMAEEITQETFFKALKAIDQFDGRCKVYVWLCQIAKNTYFTMRKRAMRNDADLEWLIKAEVGPEQRFITRESAFEIHRILHRLPEPYKEVFSLRTLESCLFDRSGNCSGRQRAGRESLITGQS